ncbi:MAG: c-type cytochrome [Blastocatellia bacterium]
MRKERFLRGVAILCFTALGSMSLIHAGAASVKTANDPVAPIQDLSGEELFKANCARCHGNNGEGGKGPNLTTEKKKAKWKDSDEKIVKKITKGGFIMPSFKKKLSETEIRTIAAYVRNLKSQS